MSILNHLFGQGKNLSKDKLEKHRSNRYSKTCSKCGKMLKPDDHAFFSTHTGDILCTSCTADSLPESKRALVYELTNNLDKLRYMAFPEHLIRERCILVPVGVLVKLWENSVVHTSLTSLTHETHGDAFRIEWNPALNKGVTHFDVYVRNFNEGIKYPNIRMSGLADFEHLRFVQGPHKKLSEDTLRICTSTGFSPLLDEILDEISGYAIFTRSIAEALIVAVHSAFIRKCRRAIIGQVIVSALSEVLKENKGDWKRFEETWGEERLDAIVDDVEAAIASDTLRLQRFVRAAEIFVLALENWL